MATGTKHYLYNLQALRFVAAALVLFGHTQHEVGDLRIGGAEAFKPLTFIDWGFGVDIFFVISGFVMYYLMHDSFGKRGAPISFWRRRIIRVVPMYWLFTTLMIVASLLLASQVSYNKLETGHVIASYLFIPWMRSDGGVFPILSLGWTLNYEIFFYAAFGLALFLPRRIGLMALVAGFLLLVVVAALSSRELWLLKFWGDPIILEFLAGIGLAAIFLSGYRLAPQQAFLTIAVGVVIAVIMAWFHMLQYVPRVVTGGIPAFLVASGVVLLRGEEAKNSRLGKLFVLGGDASYVLYLSHPFSINIVALIWQKLALPSAWLFVLVAVIAAIIGSVVAHFVIERPLLKLLAFLR